MDSHTDIENNVLGRWFQVARRPSWFGNSLRRAKQLLGASGRANVLEISSDASVEEVVRSKKIFVFRLRLRRLGGERKEKLGKKANTGG